jgi:hypothetical protein
MINENRALKRIKRNLKNILQAAPLLKQANGAGRVFELYVMLRIAKELKSLGWAVVPLASDGTNLFQAAAPGVPAIKRPFVQRGGAPTGIIPGTSPGPSSIKISKNGTDLEIWNGVQFRGRSGALHELDIAIVPHALATALRAGAVEGFPYGRPAVAIECKDIGSIGTPDELRSLIARMYDITILYGHLAYLGLPNGYLFDSPTPTFAAPFAPSTFRNSNKNSLCALARRTGLSSGALAMTALFNIFPYTNVTQPSVSANALVSDIASWIDSHL